MAAFTSPQAALLNSPPRICVPHPLGSSIYAVSFTVPFFFRCARFCCASQVQHLGPPRPLSSRKGSQSLRYTDTAIDSKISIPNMYFSFALLASSYSETLGSSSVNTSGRVSPDGGYSRRSVPTKAAPTAGPMTTSTTADISRRGTTR